MLTDATQKHPNVLTHVLMLLDEKCHHVTPGNRVPFCRTRTPAAMCRSPPWKRQQAINRCRLPARPEARLIHGHTAEAGKAHWVRVQAHAHAHAQAAFAPAVARANARAR